MKGRIGGDQSGHLAIETCRSHDGGTEVDDAVDGDCRVEALVDGQPWPSTELAFIQPSDVHLSEVGGERRQAVHDQGGVMAGRDGAPVGPDRGLSAEDV